MMKKNKFGSGGSKKGGMTKKRYADGGMAGAAVDLEASARRGENLRELDRMDFSVPKVGASDKKETFSSAFAAARKRGDKTFTWNGGSYGTKMKGEDDKPTKAASSAPTKAASSAPTKVASSAPTKPAAGKPIRVGSESAKAAGTKLAAAAKSANNALESVNEQTKTQSRNMAKLREKNPDIFTQLGKAYKAERASHADSNQKLVDRYKKEGRPNLAKAVSYLSGAKYAKGGSVSKRADGIAKKGKTKGKMV